MTRWETGVPEESEMGRSCASPLQFENPHGGFEYNIGILWRNGGEVVGEGNAGAAEADVGNGAIPRR